MFSNQLKILEVKNGKNAYIILLGSSLEMSDLSLFQNTQPITKAILTLFNKGSSPRFNEK